MKAAGLSTPSTPVVAPQSLNIFRSRRCPFPISLRLGSPLGSPHVKAKIIEERGYDPDVRTPSIVDDSWVNFADRKDPVAADIHLRDDYGPNRKNVRAKDDLVWNSYYTIQQRKKKKEKKENHHKSYGYLRTPELSKHVKAFLES